MVKLSSTLLAIMLALSLGVCGGALAAPPTDNDNDGYKSNRDCNDNDNTIYPGAPETECDGIDQDCDGSDLCQGSCTDADGDGYDAYDAVNCATGNDCNDGNADVYPGAPEICDTIDNQCPGDAGYGQIDENGVCDSPHANLSYNDYPNNCLSCHDGGEGGSQYTEMWNSTHYKWVGDTPDMANQGGTQQGKLTNGVNSYCINILGNWPVCGSCHVGRGIKPGDGDTKANIDCLMCHSIDYANARTRQPDGSMDVATPTDAMVRNVAKPTRRNCLLCHAKAGGGNGVKRGDLSIFVDGVVDNATDNNTDADFDVHMNTTASDLSCQSCHVFQNHKTIGKGSDIRPTDDTARGSEVACTTCHTEMLTGSGHDSLGRRDEPDRHIARVACQSCHIPTYAKLATEVYRDWRFHHDGTPADGASGPGHPWTEKLADQIPEYLFWNRLSDNYLLGDDAEITYDAAKNTYPTSRPVGDINDGKLYPFKYKTADQPIIRGGDCDGQLLALDTFEYLKVSGDVDQAIAEGLANMNCTGGTIEWITTDTYQLINHGVNPASGVADCSQCHSGGNLDLANDSMLDAMGYKLKGVKEEVCNQCHDGSKKLPRTHEKMHNHINKGSGIGCMFCHDFERPERGLCSPCDGSGCESEFVDNVPYPHQCN